MSSVAVHHDMRPRWQGHIDEDHPTRPGSPYGACKAAVEVHLWAAHFGEGRHTSAFRPSAVYGIDPNLERTYGCSTIKSLKSGQPFNKPGGGKFVHVEDVAAAITAAVGNLKAAGRAFDLTDCYARWADWAHIAADLLGVNVPIDLSSPPQPKNKFSKDAAKSLGVKLDRGHEGIRAHLQELIAVMREGSITTL
jgi:nucleoside-diphosphate-sugar epimerase